MERFTALRDKHGISAFGLKIIAIVTMLIDHTGAVFFPEEEWVRIIGRIAFPIFCFFIAEGAFYTSNIRKYEIRLLVFAMISEIPFDLAFFDTPIFLGHQNVFWTLLGGLIVLDILKQGRQELTAISFVIVALLCQFFHTDYGMVGVLFILMFYLLREKPFLAQGGMIVVNTTFYPSGIQKYAALSSLLMLFYNGKRGKKMRWIFYLFYPAHLILFCLIKLL